MVAWMKGKGIKGKDLRGNKEGEKQSKKALIFGTVKRGILFTHSIANLNPGISLRVASSSLSNLPRIAVFVERTPAWPHVLRSGLGGKPHKQSTQGKPFWHPQ